MRISLSLFVMGVLSLSIAWAGDVQSELMAKEKMLWTAWGNQDADSFKSNVTQDAVQIGSSGSYTGLEAILKAMSAQSCEMRNFDAQNIASRQLGPDAIVLNYTYTQEGECNGEKLPPRVSATSIYVRKDGSWKSAHYHESPLN